MTQLELFGPCVMGRYRKSEADRLLDCERRAKALGLRIEESGDYIPGSIPAVLAPYRLVRDGGEADGYEAVPEGMDVGMLEETLAIIEAEPDPDDGDDPDPGKVSPLPRALRAAARRLRAA